MKKLTGEFRETVVLDGKDPATKLYCTEFNDNNNPDDDRVFNAMVNRIKKVATKPILIVSVDASHAGYVNDNWRYYKPETGTASARSWLNPYPKPVLVEHRLHDGFTPSEDPIGRVVKGVYVPFQLTDRQRNDIITRKGVQRTYSTIVGLDNIEKVMDGRYLTVSTRGTSNSILCSVCKQELKEGDCEHEPGDKYEGKLAYMIYDLLTFREWSYVKLPADVLAKTNRYELIVPAETISSGDGQDSKIQKILPVGKQVAENIGMIGCDCPDAHPNVSIYLMPSDGVFFDMIPNNADGSVAIQHVLDGVDLYECKGGVCSYKGDAVDGEEDNKSNEFSDQNTNLNKEDDGTMENIKSFTDLMKLDWFKKEYDKYETDQVSQLKQDVSAKEGEITTLKADLGAKDKVIEDKDKTIKDLEDKVGGFEGKRKEQLVVDIIDLQKEMKHPVIEAINKKEKDTQAKELEDHKKKLLERDAESLDYLYKDLHAEKALKDKESAAAAAGNANNGGQGNISGKVDPNNPPVNNQAADGSGNNAQDSDKNNPVDKIFG